MDYLRSNTTASATGLFVICRHLTTLRTEQTTNELQRALQPLRLSSTESDVSSVLSTSLTVGKYLGVIEQDPESSGWTVNDHVGQHLRSGEWVWPWFRGELLQRINERGLEQIRTKNRPSDLVVGLTWLMQMDPLDPLRHKWSDGPESYFNSLGWRAIQNDEQWRPLIRWAISLGLARLSPMRKGRARVVVPDATTAIMDQLIHLPTMNSGNDWLGALRKRIPIFGSAEFLGQLPQGGTDWMSLPPAVSLGLLKLEVTGSITLESSDDATEIVIVGLDERTRQVGRIKLESR